MPAYPYTIENGHGEALTWLRVVHEAGGDRIEAEAVAQPGAGPPMHVHKLQEEAARVVSGKMGYQLIDGQKLYAGPGELVVWPPGTAHKWWNAGDTELRMTGYRCRLLIRYQQPDGQLSDWLPPDQYETRTTDYLTNVTGATEGQLPERPRR